MFRKLTLAGVVALLAAFFVGTGVASAHTPTDNGLQPVASVDGATPVGSCSRHGNQSWNVTMTVTVKNVKQGLAATVDDVVYSSDHNGYVQVVDNGGLHNGTVVPAGVSTTTYHPVIKVTVPCGTQQADIDVKIGAHWPSSSNCCNSHNNHGHNQCQEYWYDADPVAYLAGGTGVPALEIGGIALAALAVGGLFVLKQHRSRTATVRS